MASQSYILEREEKILAAITAIRELREAFQGERDRNEGEVLNENADLWYSVELKSQTLANEADQFREAI